MKKWPGYKLLSQSPSKSCNGSLVLIARLFVRAERSVHGMTDSFHRLLIDPKISYSSPVNSPVSAGVR